MTDQYPFGPLVQMLMLTGCRLNEAAGAQWREFNGAWVIPAKRFKSGQEHRLPITDDMRALVDALPKFKSGDFLFSTRYGVKPVSGFSKAKRQIDAQQRRHCVGLEATRWRKSDRHSYSQT